MHLWLLRPRDDLPISDHPWEPFDDKAFGFVVRAETEADARQLANAAGGDECGPIRTEPYRVGGDPWLDPRYSSCVELLPDGPPGVIILDYRQAG
jgi:hypothetical protein